MPANLSSLSRDRGQFTHTFGDGSTLTITYRPGRITPRQLRRVQALEGHADDLTNEETQSFLDEQTRLLASVLVDWDLQDDDGNRIEPTYEGLQDVDYMAQSVILNMIVEDQSPPKPSGTATLPGSSTQNSASPVVVPMIPSSRRPHRGTTTAKQPNGSA